jgi:hypothetical protein
MKKSGSIKRIALTLLFFLCYSVSFGAEYHTVTNERVLSKIEKILEANACTHHYEGYDFDRTKVIAHKETAPGNDLFVCETVMQSHREAASFLCYLTISWLYNDWDPNNISDRYEIDSGFYYPDEPFLDHIYETLAADKGNSNK